MFFPFFYLLMYYQCGTVFQTAFLTFLVIPRLRPGLLSLCSVLSSRQPFLLLAVIPRLRPGLLSLCSVLSSRQLLLCSFAFGSLALFKIYHG